MWKKQNESEQLFFNHVRKKKKSWKKDFLTENEMFWKKENVIFLF